MDASSRSLVKTAARYLGFMGVANLIWEFAHMPLYTVWSEGTTGEVVFNGIHCTIGDVMIAASSLAIGGLVAGRKSWPYRRRIGVAVVTIFSGVFYTAFSEWLNVSVRESWAYSAWMPLLPGTMIGLSPLAQWLILPSIGFAMAYRLADDEFTKG